jgi:hypothetical protein
MTYQFVQKNNIYMNMSPACISEQPQTLFKVEEQITLFLHIWS